MPLLEDDFIDYLTNFTEINLTPALLNLFREENEQKPPQENTSTPYKISKEDFERVLKCLTAPSTKINLKKIIIEDIELSQKKVSLLLNTIANNHGDITNFEISLINCGLTEEAFKIIARFIHTKSNFSKIDLSRNPINKEALTYLAAALINNKTLKELILGNTPNTENKPLENGEYTNKKIDESENQVESDDNESEEISEKDDHREIKVGIYDSEDDSDKKIEEKIIKIVKDDKQNLNNEQKLTNDKEMLLPIFAALPHSNLTKIRLPKEYMEPIEVLEIFCHILYDIYLDTDPKKKELSNKLSNVSNFDTCSILSLGLTKFFLQNVKQNDKEHIKIMTLVETTYKNLILIKEQFTENQVEKKPLLKFFGSMKNRVGKGGYTRFSVAPDGDCGYTAFGITRQEAYNLIVKNINSDDLIKLLQPAIHEQLLKNSFFQYLKQKNVLNEQITHKAIIEDSCKWEEDLSIISAYLKYDILDKKIDAGWAHPGVLQALAHIQKITLYIWQLGEDLKLVPYMRTEYAQYKPKDSKEVKNLLFVNGNHFDLLDLGDIDPSANIDPIYPLNSSWSQFFTPQEPHKKKENTNNLT